MLLAIIFYTLNALSATADEGLVGATSQATTHISITIPPRVEVNQAPESGDDLVTTNMQDPEIITISETSCGEDCIQKIIIVIPSHE